MTKMKILAGNRNEQSSAITVRHFNSKLGQRQGISTPFILWLQLLLSHHVKLGLSLSPVPFHRIFVCQEQEDLAGLTFEI